MRTGLTYWKSVLLVLVGLLITALFVLPRGIDPKSSDFRALNRDAQSVAATRANVCGLKPPHDQLPDAIQHGTSPQIDRLYSGVWEVGGQEVQIGNPIDWTSTDELHRSLRASLSAWKPLRDVIDEYLRTGQERHLTWAAKQSLNFVKGRFFDNNDYRRHGVRDYIWYDMSAGMRARALSTLLPAVACETTMFTDAEFEQLFRASIDHTIYLEDEDYFVSHNNHGAFQSYGLISLCRRVPQLFGCKSKAELGEERLRAYFNERTQDTILTEHSAFYHIFLTRMASEISSNGEIFSNDFREFINKFKQDLIGSVDVFVKPSGRVAQIGDTVRGNFATEALGPSCSERESLRECVVESVPSPAKTLSPERTTFFAQNAGYAGFRQPPETPSKGTYLLMSAAFHSRVHKHADDLSFVWTEKGEDILVDAGVYGYSKPTDTPLTEENKALGYYYSDPKRIYVESIHAHNSVEIDGKSPSRKGVPFFGAGEIALEDEGGLIKIKGKVPRYDLEDGQHVRWMVTQPTEFLVVLDRISVEQNRERDFSVWHNFHQDVVFSGKVGDRYQFQSNDVGIEVWEASGQQFASKVVRGQSEPRYEGWRSPDRGVFVPSNALAFQKKGTSYFSVVVFSVDGAVRDVVVNNDQPTSVVLEITHRDCQVTTTELTP